MKSKIELNHTGVTPRITARIKDQKPGLPFRPIVTSCQGPHYYVENAYATFLKIIIPFSKFSISSTEEFIDRIADVKVNDNTIFTSFDIVSLFPSINISEVTNTT